MSPELLNIIFTGVVAVMGAMATLTARKSQRDGHELRDLRTENRAFRAQQRKADQYMGRLLRLLDFHGLPVPDPPEGLFDDLAIPRNPPPRSDRPDGSGAHRRSDP